MHLLLFGGSSIFKKVTGALQKMKANITLMEQKVGLIHINQVYDEPKK